MWSGHHQASKEVGWNQGVARGACCLVCVGGSAGPSVCVPVLRQGFICRVKDSGGGHSCLVEVSRGFLRPSLEETLAFNRWRSVGEEEEAEVVGTCQIRFLMFSLCLLLFFFCYTRSFVSVFLLLPGEGVPTWTLPFVRGTWHQDQRREWKPSKRLYGY